MRNWWVYFRCCFRGGHLWHYDGDTLGGIWIRCARCNALDEYLPGLHEPRDADVVWKQVTT